MCFVHTPLTSIEIPAMAKIFFAFDLLLKLLIEIGGVTT
jgi:hypothetical protein